MGLLTSLALRRPSVTVLAIILVLISGIFTYRNLSVELFPEIEFPLVTVTAFYPSANPEAVLREVTDPIEKAIAGIDGLEIVQSQSSENRSIVIATFEFGTDMAAAERTINANLNNIKFPVIVGSPRVGRVNPDSFPVLQLSLVGDMPIPELQKILESDIVPAVTGIDGVFGLEIAGDTQNRILVSIDANKLLQTGISRYQISQALRENNVTVPTGSITDKGRTLTIKTTHTYNSLQELAELVVGYPIGPQKQDNAPDPIRLKDVSTVTMDAGVASSIFRTNGRPSIGIGVLKDPDGNTVDVTSGVLEAISHIKLPQNVEVITVTNDGPEIQHQIATLEHEAMYGFTFAVIVVFLFMLTLRPTPIRGLLTTMRPTIVIGFSIPLSIFMGVLLMGWQGLSLNFMTLGGLAISVGRVVDDSIVVLENVYRHIQDGRERWRAALDATIEVGPAITASTLATIVVFVPLGFIQGLVGSFFVPFALAVSFALSASLLVALTAVPVLGAYLLRPGDLPKNAGDNDDEIVDRDSAIQRFYTPILKWALHHKAVTLIAAILLTIGSLGLIAFIPITLFPSGGDRFLSVNIELPPGTSSNRTIAEASQIEDRLNNSASVIVTTVGNTAAFFGEIGPSGFNEANMIIALKEDAPDEIAASLRAEYETSEDTVLTVREIDEGGPPSSGVEISITGTDYSEISSLSYQLVEKLGTIDGIINVTSDISEARDEIVVKVDPSKAISLGLTAQQVAFQVSQYLVPQPVTQMSLDGDTVDVVLSGSPKDVDRFEKVSELIIAGPSGASRVSDIANVTIEKGPVTISRTDGTRSANITGTIIAEDTQAIGVKVQEKIDELVIPPGLKIISGGIFQQIAEGFQDIFLAMVVGIVLIYLVMVASLGSLRTPFVIVTSLPLALIGALVGLAITGRTLGLPAMMGILLMIGIVVTNAIVLIAFVEQLREKGLSVYEALIRGGRVRLRPILMTAITTSCALLPLAVFVDDEGGLIGAELATIVIGGLVSSTALTLIVVPVIYTLANESIPTGWHSVQDRLLRRITRQTS